MKYYIYLCTKFKHRYKSKHKKWGLKYMDITTFIPEIIAFVGGGGLVGLFTLKQTKEGAKIDNSAKLVAEYKELLADYKAEKEKAEQLLAEYKAKYDEQVKEFNDELLAVKHELSIVKAQLETSNVMYASANALKCTKVNCVQRIPPADIDELKSITGLNGDEEGE